MTPTQILRLAGILGGLAVAAGAFGAHGLREILDPHDLETFETAVRYQMYHALALLGCALVATRTPRAQAAAWCFLGGTVVFSGTLYALVLSGVRWLGAITPIGGSLLIIGWVVLATASIGRDAGEAAARPAA